MKDRKSPAQYVLSVIKALLAAAVLVCAALTLRQTLALYQEGLASVTAIYTQERIWAYAAPVKTAAVVSLILLFTLLIMKRCIPDATSVQKTSLECRMQAFCRGKTPNAGMLRQIRKRRDILLGITIIIPLCVLWQAIVSADPALFTGTDPDAEVAAFLLLMLPPVLVGFTAYGIAMWMWDASCKRQITAAETAEDNNNKSAPSPASKNTMTVRLVLLALAFLLIGMGILNDGLTDILMKAINICTECIGLG